MRMLTVVTLLALGLIGCGPAEPPPPPDIYETRAIVRQLPRADRPGSELYLHHEAVPDFKDDQGEVVGMQAMAMPFAVAEESMLDSLAAGDKIAITFEMHWGGGDPLRITRLDKLAPDTRLGFEKPRESEESDGGAEADPGATPAGNGPEGDTPSPVSESTME